MAVDRLRDRWKEEMERLQNQGGSLTGHRVLGTTQQGGRDVTVVHLELEQGEADWAYVWSTDAEETLRGRSARGLDPRLRFQPTGPSRFESWDGGAWTTWHAKGRVSISDAGVIQK